MKNVHSNIISSIVMATVASIMEDLKTSLKEKTIFVYSDDYERMTIRVIPGITVGDTVIPDTIHTNIESLNGHTEVQSSYLNIDRVHEVLFSVNVSLLKSAIRSIQKEEQVLMPTGLAFYSDFSLSKEAKQEAANQAVMTGDKNNNKTSIRKIKK